jgi:hypothetical protein
MNMLRLQKVFKLFFVYHTDFDRDIDEVKKEVMKKINESYFSSSYTIPLCISNVLDETYKRYTLIDPATKNDVDLYLNELYTRILTMLIYQ